MARLRRRKGTREWLISLKDLVILEPEQYKGSWHEWFGNDHPIHVELGMGKGEFITQMSAQYPHINFIGIDLYDELIRTASEKALALHEQQIDAHHSASGRPDAQVPNNLALALFNIAHIKNMFEQGEVAQFYLNFSDPWPKKRHAGRRLTHPNFVKQYIHLLQEQGEIHLRTDSRSLFEFSLNTFADMGLKMRNISLDFHKHGTPPNYITTEYEQKFMNQGMPIYRCEVIADRQAKAQFTADAVKSAVN